MRESRRAPFALLVLVPCLWGPLAEAQRRTQPPRNVIFILSDDHRQHGKSTTETGGARRA